MTTATPNLERVVFPQLRINPDDEVLGRVLLEMDRHKRWQDPDNIQGYCLAQSLFEDDLHRAIAELNLTHVIHMGDLYDRGYNQAGAQYADTLDDFLLCTALKGRYYGLIGNHLYLERDSNPEFYLIQPNPYPELQPLLKRKFREKVIRVVDDLVIGNVQFSFFHYNKTDKDYWRERKHGIKYHIGLYHDECVIPTSARNACGMQGTVSSSYLNRIYSNIDIGFAAHIHVTLGKQIIQLETGRQVPLYLQGACTINTTKPSEWHNTVKLPVITIYKSGKCQIDFVTFKLYTEVMDIYRETTKIEERDRSKYIPKKVKPNFKLEPQQIASARKYTDVHEYISSVTDDPVQGQIYDLAKEGNLNRANLFKLF